MLNGYTAEFDHLAYKIMCVSSRSKIRYFLCFFQASYIFYFFYFFN